MPAEFEPGRYKFKVTGQGFAASKSGTEFFYLGGIPQTHDMPYQRTIRLYISEKAKWSTAEKLRSIGWMASKWSTLDPATPGYHNFTGQTIEVVCKHEEYKGEMQEKWELPFGKETEAAPADHSIAGRLDTKFPLEEEKKPKVDRSRKPLAESLAEIEGDDDLPF
jgi:hypothetical protein